MQKTSKLWTSQFVVIVIMAFLFFLCLQILTAGFPAYITEIKNNPTQAGLMTTVFMGAAILTRPFIGYLIQKINVKQMSMITLAVLIFTVGLSYGQTSVALLLVLRALHGMAFGIITTILSTLATNIIPAKRLGEGIGYYGLATSVGTSAAPMFALSLLQLYSYNLMIILSVVVTITTLILGFFVKAPKVEKTADPARKVTLKEYAFDKKALLPCILAFFFTITLGGVISFLGGLGNEAGLGASISLFFLMMTIMMVVVRPFSGRLYDKLGHKVIIYPGAVSGIVGLFLLSITESTATLLIAGIFYGFSYGIMTPTLQAIAVGFVEKEKQGTANAMFFSSMDLGIALGSTGLGILAGATSYHFIYGFSIVSIVVLLLLYTLVFVKGEKAVRITETETV
ncbi:MFS transporter [Virgibacillus kekensis]|uniref:MFS transporter n=1 Tax=Virgibacillus kekensis TaxID=202261 RepID=A0ABV9DHG8_9BACI